MSTLSPQDLFSLSDRDVRAAVQSQHLLQLQGSPSVRDVFFGGARAAVGPHDPVFVDDTASALVCSSIAMSSLYRFRDCVNPAAAETLWRTNLAVDNPKAIAEGQLLYGWAYPKQCKSANATFEAYMTDGAAKWAQELASHVITDAFINVTMNKEIFGQPNWLEQLNHLFYKLYRLDPAHIDPVLSKWKAAFPDKHIVQNWDRRNFIPYMGFEKVPELFLSSVNAAIGQRTQQGTRFKTGFSQPGSGTSRGFYEPIYHFGHDVQQFLQARPKQLNLTTGAQPDNVEGGSSSCFVAGTPIHMADGSVLPIEQVGESHVVLTKDGQSATHSDETVALVLDRPTLVYGIDDGATAEEPFFSGGHLFHTDDGWKAIDVDVAHIENPGRAVGTLSAGDVIYRIRSLAPFTYERVTIRGFTAAVIQPGEKLYGLHLVDGHRSYHAHGYLVGMNYPVLTAKRLRDGLEKLTVQERRYLAARLEPALPLLRYALGDFIEEPIRQALSEH
ncbi:hypothetical protein [uncultured Paludibaculum sp.]|uniref:hypothetical protein n=1 Tax=uncultured Paludibaculum sp. TaxID=1765020 RepID=UPI002AABB097|nr:hypothetical protein [uncultured Paludibaculum sp.]